MASDAHTLGVDPMLLRDRQDEAIGIIRRLFTGERVTATSDWFTLQDAALQLLPLQEEMPCAVASQISASGMTLAGKHGIGVISIGSLSEEGLNALPTQWGFAEEAARKHGTTVDRNNWRHAQTLPRRAWTAPRRSCRARARGCISSRSVPCMRGSSSPAISGSPRMAKPWSGSRSASAMCIRALSG